MLTYQLSNGYHIPAISIGTNWMKEKELTKILVSAFEAGFRSIDTARDYGNEDIVGRALKNSLSIAGLNREEIYICTKIGNSQQALGNIKTQLEMSLRNLQTEYIDVYLMHWPYPGYYIDTWTRMVELYETSNLVKAIGVANFDIRHIIKLEASNPEIMPHVNQVEFHPLRTIEPLRNELSKRNIQLEAYAPLCRLLPQLKDNPYINRLSSKYNKSIGQIILRWHIEHGSLPIFKSYNPSRFKENIDIFDFELTPEEVRNIDSLNMDYKYHVESASCPGY